MVNKCAKFHWNNVNNKDVLVRVKDCMQLLSTIATPVITLSAFFAKKRHTKTNREKQCLMLMDDKYDDQINNIWLNTVILQCWTNDSYVFWFFFHFWRAIKKQMHIRCVLSFLFVSYHTIHNAHFKQARDSLALKTSTFWCQLSYLQYYITYYIHVKNIYQIFL